MTTPEGVYSGMWANDDKNGLGKMSYANQDDYDGAWKNGLR
jgi:hypothetical protein